MRSIVFLTCLLMSGCVTFSYTNGEERMSGTAFFKSANGLAVERGDFTFKADTTKTETQQMQMLFMEMMRLYMSMPK